MMLSQILLQTTQHLTDDVQLWSTARDDGTVSMSVWTTPISVDLRFTPEQWAEFISNMGSLSRSIANDTALAGDSQDDPSGE